MKNYDIVDYWNERNNPCSKTIHELTDKHLSYLKSQTIGCNKILDFGPGYGRMFSAYIHANEVVGIDVTEQYKDSLIKEANKQNFNFKFICKKNNFDKLDFVNKYFDVVVTSEVLFHQTPIMIEKIMRELLRVGQKVVVISYMNVNKKYDKLDEYLPSKRNCFNYNYYELCKRNQWNIRNEKIFKNQLFFVYSDVFKFKYNKKEIQFLFDRDDYYMSRIIKNTNSFYEIKYLKYLKDKNIISQNSIIVDIGSYLGNHALFFSKILNCKFIYCIEPTLYSYSILEDNLIINKVRNKNTYQIAIGAKDGKVLINKFNSDNPGANQYKYNIEGITVCKTLKSIISTKIDFLKIDVENMEIEVLKGCNSIIDKYHPIIMIEVGSKNISIINNWIIKNKYKRIASKTFNKNTWLLEFNESSKG